ncbi:MAG: hypothetical protein MPN21_27915, partial [Thermoanaerobaculia bacterium]|nr:hypothetical protein [Thermoanaerobaculia bacterium]
MFQGLRRRLRVRERARWVHSSIDRRYRQSLQRLESCRDRHRGERCVVLGNGPSLNRTDLVRVGGETTFALNRGYLLFDRLGGPASYHVCVNRLVYQQFGAEMADLECLRFATWPLRNLVRFDDQTVLVHKLSRESFSTDPTRGLWEGATVTYVALQIAYFMGFQQVILVGVDHAFENEGPPHSVVVSKGPDRDHFSPDYFGRGTRWQLPDLHTSERAYELAHTAFRDAGREVLDATVDGKLTVFP